MKTKVIRKIKTNTETATFGYWDAEQEEWIEITSRADIDTASEILDCSPELLEALVGSFEGLRDMIVQDLIDIWERFDNYAGDD